MERSFFLVIIPFLGLAMASQLTGPCEAAQAQGQPIYDMEGHELTKDNLYQILLADPKMNGLCLFAGSLSPADCPLLARCWSKGGNAVMVMPAEASGGSVPRLSSDLLLTFNHTINKCMMELQWYVGDYIDTDQMHVTVGHALGAPVPSETDTDKWFRFRAERHGNGYKLASCYKEPCRDLVLYHYKGYRWLTVEKDGRQPFVIVFKKCPWPCRPSSMSHVVMPN
ncbi:hypothetical protein ACQ4PT_026246 [Festuca glaucescens]